MAVQASHAYWGTLRHHCVVCVKNILSSPDPNKSRGDRKACSEALNFVVSIFILPPCTLDTIHLRYQPLSDTHDPLS